MTVSDLIKKLEYYKINFGDLNVAFDPYDGSCFYMIESVDVKYHKIIIEG